MSITPTTTVRIDNALKKEANKVFSKIGLSMSSAINTFLQAVVREGALPFDINAQLSTKRKVSKNAMLNKAFLNKKDEFYTTYEDIHKEMIRHEEHLKGKSIFCNCDDPFESAFFRYFVLNFSKLGISRLICTCYAESSLAGSEYPLEGKRSAYKATIIRIPDECLLRPDGALDLESLFAIQGNSLQRLKGNGDFRSTECLSYLNRSDIVITNPPFSLFREYISTLIKHDKKFIILGNMNAVTCKEIFPLFRDNKIWYGESIKSGDRKFYVPDDYPLSASNCGIDDKGRRFIRVTGVRWFTNLDTRRRHKKIQLTRNYSIKDYPTYENYDAIEVSRTQNIPADYTGVMGVPITFLDKFCPEQFEIIMLANGNARSTVSPKTLADLNYRPHTEDRGGVGILNGKRIYARIMIRRKTTE